MPASSSQEEEELDQLSSQPVKPRVSSSSPAKAPPQAGPVSPAKARFRTSTITAKAEGYYKEKKKVPTARPRSRPQPRAAAKAKPQSPKKPQTRAKALARKKTTTRTRAADKYKAVGKGRTSWETATNDSEVNAEEGARDADMDELYSEDEEHTIIAAIAVKSKKKEKSTKQKRKQVKKQASPQLEEHANKDAGAVVPETSSEAGVPLDGTSNSPRRALNEEELRKAVENTLDGVNPNDIFSEEGMGILQPNKVDKGKGVQRSPPVPSSPFPPQQQQNSSPSPHSSAASSPSSTSRSSSPITAAPPPLNIPPLKPQLNAIIEQRNALMEQNRILFKSDFKLRAKIGRLNDEAVDLQNKYKKEQKRRRSAEEKLKKIDAKT